MSGTQGEAESRMAKICKLEERVRMMAMDKEVHREACAHLDKLIAERVSLAAGAEQVQKKHDILTNPICQLEVEVATCDGSWALSFKLCSF